MVRDAHLNEDLLDSVEFDVSLARVLLRQQPERVLNIGAVELTVAFERENLQELRETQLRLFLE